MDVQVQMTLAEAVDFCRWLQDQPFRSDVHDYIGFLASLED